MPVTKDCEFCGNPFTVRPAKGHQRFCSFECQKAKREEAHATLTCVNCGTLFAVTKRRELQRQFCSSNCQREHQAVHGRPGAQYERKETTHFTCKQCGKSFSYKPGYLAEYRRKYGHDPLYCSIPCSALGRRADTEARSTFVCEQCGKENPMKRYEGTGRTVYYRQQRFCDQACKVAWQMAEAARRFEAGNIGRHVKRNGYVWISVPANIAGGKKREVMEHRWVMEQSIGRPLETGETVHHKDGDRSNNTIENLQLFVSNHGPGQEIDDIIVWCVKMLTRYADFARRAGYELVKVHDSP